MGCWDRVEIERNAFILGLGIDLGEEDTLLVTYQIALLDAFKGEEGEKTKSTQQISIESDTLSKAANTLLRYFGNIPNFTHCKLIVFGGDYAKSGIKESLDYLFRETEIRRVTSVCVTKGKAKEVLDFEPKTAPSSAMVIDQIVSQNSTSNSGIYPFLDVGYLHQNFVRGSDIGIVQVTTNKDAVEVSGEGVFKNFKLVGWYTDQEVTGQRFILGQIEKALLTAHLPPEKGGRIILDAYNINTSTIPKIIKDNIKISVKIRMEGDVNEIQNPVSVKNTEELLRDWKRAFEEHVHTTVNDVYIKGRDLYNTDSFEIDDKIENYYPEFWKKNKGKWDELFKNVELELDIDVKIRRIGVTEP